MIYFNRKSTLEWQEGKKEKKSVLLCWQMTWGNDGLIAKIVRGREKLEDNWMYSFDEVKNVDPEIAQAIVDEQNRQNSHIELIA